MYYLQEYLHPGDCLALNETEVIPARFFLQRETGGIIEGLFLHLDAENRWQVLLKSAGRLKTKELIYLYHPPAQEKTTIEFIVEEKQTEGPLAIMSANRAVAFGNSEAIWPNPATSLHPPAN